MVLYNPQRQCQPSWLSCCTCHRQFQNFDRHAMRDQVLLQIGVHHQFIWMHSLAFICKKIVACVSYGVSRIQAYQYSYTRYSVCVESVTRVVSSVYRKGDAVSSYNLFMEWQSDLHMYNLMHMYFHNECTTFSSVHDAVHNLIVLTIYQSLIKLDSNFLPIVFKK